jgi:hypothetical protein
MKKILLILLLLTISLASVSISYSLTIKQLTHNSYDDAGPQINDNGYVVWSGDDGSNYEIFLYDGMTTVQLTDNFYDDWDPQINGNGYVVWYGFDGTDWEIFLYNGMTIAQLTDDSYPDRDPQINDNGYVVWSGSDGSDYEIFLYNGMTIAQLTNKSYSDSFPQINDNGYVVWYGFDNTDSESEIFLYNGMTIAQLTDDSYPDRDPRINDNGYVVWSGSDGSDYEIFLYDGITIAQLTDNSYDDWFPQINDNGYVVWLGWDGSDYEIFLYDGITIAQLTDNSYEDAGPQINDNGYVVWLGYDGNDYEIFLYDGMTTVQLTDNSYDDWDPQINGNGYVVWYGFDGTDWEIFVTSAFTPNGGEVLPSGGIYTIRWDAPIEAVNFKLKYSMDNGLTWNPIPNTGDFVQGKSYDWTVPKPWGNKKNCLVKVTWYDSSGAKIGADRSDAPFTIEVVKLTSPNGGDTLTSGDIHTVTWATNNTKNPVAKVKLYYTKDGGSTWNSIFTFRDTNPGSYDWQVPCVRNDKASCKVKVTLFDDSGNIVGEDASNGYFTIARTCTDISGNWDGTDKITVTCCYQGQCESGTSIGSASIFINQNDCKINWTIPGTNIKRSGIIWCNNFEVSGIFCNPEELPGAIFSINQLNASGTVNGDTATLIGWGQCSGTYQGVAFECSGRDKTVLTRSLFGITEEKQTAREPKLFMNNSLRIFGVISP